ncbi:hypothetical protein BTO30_11260 [Domibacillus antri]|uniref:Uncharacterized protein n=1 Tax=Domibacillus antri TaxID=1714264 RepID=A0A1Q8Q4D1_9BACI|nr:hypothetical protein [Domibacillus antri]OLN22145.1 hypothetical protein BTO30_11260 [Domibacillus antri]
MLMQILVFYLLCVVTIVTITIFYQLKLGKELLKKLEEIMEIVKQKEIEKDTYTVNQRETKIEDKSLKHEEVPLATGFMHVVTDKDPARLNISITKNN